MNRDKIMHSLDELYRTRLTNDPSVCIHCFADDGALRLSGTLPNGDPMPAAQGRAALSAALKELTDTWRWRERETLSLTIDGNQAAVRYRLTTDHIPSGQVIVTEIMDHVRFDDDARVLEVVEYVDTALIERLSQY
ncbi:MAG: nuclear transport factor 2 family protein [Pseudomonadota bacterium]